MSNVLLDVVILFYCLVYFTLFDFFIVIRRAHDKEHNPCGSSPGVSHPCAPCGRGSLLTTPASGQGLGGSPLAHPAPRRLPPPFHGYRYRCWSWAPSPPGGPAAPEETLEVGNTRDTPFSAPPLPGGLATEDRAKGQEGGTSVPGTQRVQLACPTATPRARLAGRRPGQSGQAGWSFRSEAGDCRTLPTPGPGPPGLSWPQAPDADWAPVPAPG